MRRGVEGLFQNRLCGSIGQCRLHITILSGLVRAGVRHCLEMIWQNSSMLRLNSHPKCIVVRCRRTVLETLSDYIAARMDKIGNANYSTLELLSFAKVMKPVHGTVVMGRGGFSLPNQGD